MCRSWCSVHPVVPVKTAAAPPVGQSGAAGVRVEVGGGHGDSGPAVGEEDRPGLAVTDEWAGGRAVSGCQFTGRSVAAFADDDGSLGGLVDVFDVEAEGFFGAHRGVEQEPPQGLVTRRKVASAPQPFELVGGDDPQVGVAAFVAAADPGGRVCARPALPGAVGEEAAEGGEVEVPGGRRGVPVVGVEEPAHGAELEPVDGLVPGPVDEAVQAEAVGAAGLWSQVTLGQEGLDGVGDRGLARPIPT